MFSRLRRLRCIATCGGVLLGLSAFMPPLHLHVEADHDHDHHDHAHVILHRHFAAHHTPVPGSGLSDDDGPAIVLDQQAVNPESPIAARVVLVLLWSMAPPVIERSGLVYAPQVDASPPHGPPKHPDSLRAPPARLSNA